MSQSTPQISASKKATMTAGPRPAPFGLRDLLTETPSQPVGAVTRLTTATSGPADTKFGTVMKRREPSLLLRSRLPTPGLLTASGPDHSPKRAWKFSTPLPAQSSTNQAVAAKSKIWLSTPSIFQPILGSQFKFALSMNIPARGGTSITTTSVSTNRPRIPHLTQPAVSLPALSSGTSKQTQPARRMTSLQPCSSPKVSKSKPSPANLNFGNPSPSPSTHAGASGSPKPLLIPADKKKAKEKTASSFSKIPITTEPSKLTRSLPTISTLFQDLRSDTVASSRPAPPNLFLFPTLMETTNPMALPKFSSTAFPSPTLTKLPTPFSGDTMVGSTVVTAFSTLPSSANPAPRKHNVSGSMLRSGVFTPSLMNSKSTQTVGQINGVSTTGPMVPSS